MASTVGSTYPDPDDPLDSFAADQGNGSEGDPLDEDYIARRREWLVTELTKAKKCGCDCEIEVSGFVNGAVSGLQITHADSCPYKRIARAWLN